MSTKKPAKTTMEGMIWHANDILTKAISDKSSGLPKDVVKNCHGVVLVSVVEVGAIFSGSKGSGIIMAKDPAVPGLKWSPPCACTLSGVGFGLLLGAAHTDLLIFIMDTPTLNTFVTDEGFVCNGQNTYVLGNMGRAGELNLDPVNNGVIIASYANGAYAGVSIEGAKFRPNGKANNAFYGKPVLAQKILEGVAVQIPDGKVTLIDEVHKKLEIIQNGGTAEPDAAETAKVEAAAVVADSAHDAIKDDSEIVQVDIKEEAAKGN